jgi:hypothetical protein
VEAVGDSEGEQMYYNYLSVAILSELPLELS